MALPRPAFPPSPCQHCRPLRDAPASNAARSPRQGREGRQLRGHSTQPPRSLSARLSLDGVEGQAVAAAVTLPAPAAGQQGTFWAIFSHFGSPSAVRSTVTAAPQISAQSPCFAVHISSPHAVYPFPLGGTQLPQPPLLASNRFAFPQHHSGCVPSLPAGPLPEAGKPPRC